MPIGEPKQGRCVYPRTLLKKTVDMVTAHELQWLLSVTRSAIMYSIRMLLLPFQQACCIQPHFSASIASFVSLNAEAMLHLTHTHTCTTSRLLWLQAELC